MTPHDDDIGLFPIRTVSELTGVNSVTLRAWERRYGLVTPYRTAKGHRLYTEQDIAAIKQVVALLEQGVPISRAGAALKQTPATDPEPPTPDGPWSRYQQRMIAAVTGFDESQLEQVYNEAMSLYPVDIVTRLLLIPLLQELGERWQNSLNGVAEEHFFAVYMRNKLGARFHHRERSKQGHCLVAACLPGEHHELGLLLFALAAHDRGFRLVLLGANMPLDQLAGVAETVEADGVVLSGSVIGDPGVIRNALSGLVERLSIPVFIGGSASVTYQGELARAGAIAVGENLLQGLTRIHQHLHPDAGHREEQS